MNMSLTPVLRSPILCIEIMSKYYASHCDMNMIFYHNLLGIQTIKNHSFTDMTS